MYYGTGRYTGALELTGATTKGLLYEPQFNMMTAFFSTRAAPSGFSMSSEPEHVAENPEWILEESMGFRSDFVPIAIRAIRD